MRQQPSIGLSLRGDGVVVRVSNRNVRHILRMLQESTTDGIQSVVHGLRHDWITDDDQCDSVYRRLTSGRQGRASTGELQRLQKQLNYMIVRQRWRLPPRLPDVLAGSAVVTNSSVNRRRSLFVTMNAVIYEVRQISRSQLLAGGDRDVILQDHDRQLSMLRFLGIKICQQTRSPIARFANRYDLEIAADQPLRSFHARQIFQVLRAQPLEGFHFDGIRPFLRG